MYRGEFAETEEEADRWVQAVIAGKRPDARRPPELLTRDVVARAIRREVREGRGSPHGGVFLDIASRRTPEEIKKKLPGMYHQFKELADVDITTEPMEVGPTCHYMMGGVRVDPETQESTVPGLFAAGEVGGGMHGANRLGGNSLSDLLVFGKRAGEYAAEHAAARCRRRPRSTTTRSSAVAHESLAPFERSERRESLRRPRRAASGDAEATWASCARRKICTRRSTELGRASPARGERQSRRQHPVQSRLAPGARPEEHARRQRSGDAGGARAHREPRRPHARGLSRFRRRSGAR